MFGRLLSLGTRIVTLPLDVGNSVIDVASGGDGSKRSKQCRGNPLVELEDVRDELADSFKSLDDM
jgi:hypothetical protein